MGLKVFSLKIQEELLEEIHREAETRKISCSEVMRQRLAASGLEAAAVSELVARVNQLEQQVSYIGKEITLVAAAQESLAATADSIKENLARLVELLNQEKNFPFGMNRKFVQVATMASFALARGTFSNSPEAWEPYKEEARTRAFKSGEGDP